MNKKTSGLIFASLLGLSGIISLYFLLVVDDDAPGGEVDTFMSYLYILFGTTILLTVVFSLLDLIKSSKSILSTLLPVIALLVVGVLSYVLASDVVLSSYLDYDITSSTSKNVGTYLNIVYILVILSVSSIVYDTVIGVIK